ncbi:hypothetical protein Bca4012_039654 [Brassica carinata]|uniref:Uncharacterized protein n=1 Tax=Brassica carinata TaxID=52824 RepID=A0A8X8B8A2_BRACI|nr:hypothetical protein Bca52824_007890 [Brassica carinata]
MAPLVAAPASLPRPSSDPPDSNLKVALPSNPPDPPVPPDPPPDTLSFTGFLQLYDFWATVTFPHKFLDLKLGSIVLKMVLFEAEAKIFIVSCLDGVNCLISLTIELDDFVVTGVPAQTVLVS